MEKIFKNKKLAYVLIGILLALQLTQSIANWCGGGFNGGSLVLCILMLGLLTLVGVGVAKNNKLLTIVSGASILSVVIYVLVSQYSGLIQEWIDGKVPAMGLASGLLGSIGTLLMICCLVFVLIKAFGMTKKIKIINTIFSLIAAVVFLVVFIIAIAVNPDMSSTLKVYLMMRDLFAMFIALLIPCVWHQVEAKE